MSNLTGIRASQIANLTAIREGILVPSRPLPGPDRAAMLASAVDAYRDSPVALAEDITVLIRAMFSEGVTDMIGRGIAMRTVRT